VRTDYKETLPELLDRRSQEYPHKPFLIVEDKNGIIEEYRYREFVDKTERVAAGFASLGIKKGDAVVLHLPNCAEFVLSWFALARLGAITVPSNTSNKANELEYVISHSEAVACVIWRDYSDLLRSPLLKGLPIRNWILARESANRETELVFEELLATSSPSTRVAVDPEDVVELLYTSGTTARPKGVMVTHANCVRSGKRAALTGGLSKSSRCITSLPAFHANAQSTTILAALAAGGTCILIEEYSASKFWAQVRHHRASCVSLVAMQVRTLLAQPIKTDERDHALKSNFYAINVLDSEKDAFELRFGVRLLNGYGLSEAFTIVTRVPLEGDRRWPSVGIPAPDRTVRIVDDDGLEVPPGVNGEIIVSGTPGLTLMSGYFKDMSATQHAIRDGWLYTGDNGHIDKGGFLYFVDRKKDIIKRAGENVSPTEVESVLLRHPKVLEAAVLGVPDAIRDEAVKAYVVAVEGALVESEELRAFCSAELASFKVPSVIEFRNSLPKTSVGKIEKKLLKEVTSDGR